MGGSHRILLHDLETAVKLGKSCWWAGFTAALHIDIDEVSPKIKSHLDNIVRLLKKPDSKFPIQNREAVHRLESKPKTLSSLLREAFLKVHKKVGIRIFVDERTSRKFVFYILLLKYCFFL